MGKTQAGIPFVQHLMPDGRTQSVWIERPLDVERRASDLIAAGFSFHCEMLRDYCTCSFTIEHADCDCDLACELAKNGPDVLSAVDKLILNFQPEQALAGEIKK